MSGSFVPTAICNRCWTQHGNYHAPWCIDGEMVPLSDTPNLIADCLTYEREMRQRDAEEKAARKPHKPTIQLIDGKYVLV